MRGRAAQGGQHPQSASVNVARLQGLAACLLVVAAAPTVAWGQAAGTSSGSLFSGGGSLRSTVEGLSIGRPRVNTGLAWTTQASLGVQVGATDNPGDLNGQNKWSLTSLISPNFSLEGSSARLTAQLAYAPQIVLYSAQTNQNRVSHNLNAGATATLVPDTLFLEVRAYAADQPAYGSTYGFTSQQAQAFQNSNASSQTASVSVSPYATHRFGGWGTLTAGYSLQHSFLGSVNNANTLQNSSLSGLPGYGTTGNLTTHQEYVRFVTGENFNRFQYQFNATTSQYSGGGQTFQGGDNYSLNNTLSYAFSRVITLLGTLGYETIGYGGATAFNANYVNWTIGTRVTPNQDSSLTIQYGESQGASTWLFNGNYTPTPRLSFYGSYTTSITTYLQQQQALLQGTVVGPNGILIDRTTGAPVSSVNPFGIQNSPTRVYQLTFGASYLLNRDVFTANLTRYNTTTLTQSSSATGTVVPTGTSGSGITGGLSWQHDLNPITNVTSAVSYGTSDNGAFLGSPGSSQKTFSASTNLSHTFTESLTGTVSYSYIERTGATGAAATVQGLGNSSQNLFLVGLRKIF